VATNGGNAPDTIAGRLDRLFHTVRNADGKPYSYREVAEAITATGEPISHSYIRNLRTDPRANPTVQHLRALARFFGVPVEYFTSEQLAVEVDRELDLAAALREMRVQTVALRESVLPEAEASLAALAKIVDVIRGLEQGGTTESNGAD
jgi:transcriptional regulator with XRE-family HTH domain